MEYQKESTSVEGPRFISEDNILLLNELKDLCYFPSPIQRKQFIASVCESVGAKSFKEITELNFGTAYLTALGILHRVGEEVFKSKSNRGTYEE
jgi:hypothetical protein